MKYYTIGEFGKLIRKSVPTLREWDRKDILKPHHLSAGNHRVYSEDQLYEILNLVHEKKEKLVIGYCRVSTPKQKDDLRRQVEAVKSYMISRGYRFEVIEDVGSGINYNKKGLADLIDRILRNDVEKVVLLYKDRLVRFGFELIESLCRRHGVSIEIIDNTPRNEEQELVEDLVQIVTVFSCKLQGKRANRAKKILREVMELDKEHEDSGEGQEPQALST